MFYSRKNEINKLNNLFKNTGKSVLLYGKRRVGKTELIKQIAKGYTLLYFECIKSTLEENVHLFVLECKKSGVDIPEYANFNSFIDIFNYLNSLKTNYLVAIDEYQYLKELSASNVIDSIFQTIIDRNISNMNLIISGSAIRIMKDLLV